MRTLIFISLFYIMSFQKVQAQTTFYLQDLTGQPIKGNYANVTGSPYLFDDWKVGSVLLSDNKRFDMIPLKYDVVRDVLIFKKSNDSDSALEFNSQPSEFKFNDIKSIFVAKRDILKNESGAGFVEIIYNGKISLLKKHGKRLIRKREYNSAITEQQIEDFYSYYIIDSNNGRYEEVKSLNEKVFLSYLGDQAIEVKRYADSKRLSFRKENDLKLILSYYSSK